MRNTTNYYKFRQQVTPAALSQIESGPQQIGNLCSSHGFRLHFDAGENIYALETPNMVDMYPITLEQLLTKAFPLCSNELRNVVDAFNGPRYKAFGKKFQLQ